MKKCLDVVGGGTEGEAFQNKGIIHGNLSNHVLYIIEYLLSFLSSIYVFLHFCDNLTKYRLWIIIVGNS